MRRYTAGFNGNPAGLSYDWRTIDEYLACFDRRVAINVAYLIPNGNVRMEVMGLDPRPATRRRDPRDAEAGARRDGRRGHRPLDRARLHSQPLCRCPRDRRLVRADRRGERCLRHPHAGLRAAGAPSGCARFTISPRRPAFPPTSRITTGRPICCSRLIDRGSRARARPDVRHLSLSGGEHDPGHDRPAALGPGRRDRRHRRTTARPGGPRPARSRSGSPASHALRPREHHDRHGGEPRLAVGRRAHRRRGGRSRPRADPGDFVCEILSASGMAVGIVAFRPGERTEADVRAILRHPAHMAGSDGIFCGGFPHPRGWGAFARYLGYHTRELGDYSWPEAVTHLATHAARRFRLTDRGLIRPGFVADIAVFDPASGDRPLDLRRRANPGRRRRSRAGQRHARPGERRADRSDPRPCTAEGMTVWDEAWEHRQTKLLADDFQLGHLGRLDVLDADLGGELLDDCQEIRPRRGAGEQGLVHLALRRRSRGERC